MCFCCAADIPEEEARYWAKKLEQLNAMRDQDVRPVVKSPLFVSCVQYYFTFTFIPSCL